MQFENASLFVIALGNSRSNWHWVYSCENCLIRLESCFPSEKFALKIFSLALACARFWSTKRRANFRVATRIGAKANCAAGCIAFRRRECSMHIQFLQQRIKRVHPHTKGKETGRENSFYIFLSLWLVCVGKPAWIALWLQNHTLSAGER